MSTLDMGMGFTLSGASKALSVAATLVTSGGQWFVDTARPTPDAFFTQAGAHTLDIDDGAVSGDVIAVRGSSLYVGT